MSKLTKLKKVKIPPFAMLISGLVIVGLLTAIGGILGYNTQLDNSQVIANEILKQQTAEPTQGGKAAQNKASNPQSSSNESNPNTDETRSPSSHTASSGTIARDSSSSSSGSRPDSKISYVKVFLNVNGSPKGNVSLKSNANQCEVLAQAKAQGVINSLDMRYNRGLNSYGVYMINGIGRTDQVYWTYAVNGKSPPLGCSYITVHGGDSINWQYIN